ncbi:Mov34/MPN/PAD-1 family protein [Pseudomonas trivialis]|uniref:Thiamine biosynthesis protein ThiF n=1 Tax=Pseudomonas trivialis TaxID=200450 RepID=A0A0H5ADJ3_9PSED|nr:Mov34/MPN/PAD-1 family protein [Pseudomonas trivialis]AKS09101.1 hypothetical protein AA957_24285 [Pseudomonas trivialis]
MDQQFEAARSRLARSVVEYLSKATNHTYANLVSVGHRQDFDFIDIDLELQLIQRRRVPIRTLEPIRIYFMANDDSDAPIVLSRRKDFPIGMVHTNLDRLADGSLCLCIWEEGWADLATNLTGQVLVERIRAWFSSMAAGTIHDMDQRLEPLIHTGSNTLIIPPGQVEGPWHIHAVNTLAGSMTLLMSNQPSANEIFANNFAIYAPELPAQTHRGLASTPSDLGALQQLCLELDFDLVRGLSDWLLQTSQLEGAGTHLPMLILTVPKCRTDGGPAEEHEVWCFSFGDTVAVFGERLDVSLTVNGVTQRKILGDLKNVNLGAIQLEPWRVVPRLDRIAARRFSGAAKSADTRLLGIGAGAIGSNVAMIATRSGLGPWTVVDGDISLPHNTVRQVHRNNVVGFPKADALRYELDLVLAEGGNASISVDVLKPGEQAEALRTALHQSDLSVDFSASPAVLSWLSDQQINRAVSAFFGPDGSDLVVLAESADRLVKIDEIEAQYFWAVASDARMKDHLVAARLDRIRYANACQDLSRPLPPWQTHLLCGLAAGRLAQILNEEEPSLRVWRLNTDSGAVESIPLPVHAVSRFGIGKIRVTVSNEAVQIMRELRRDVGRNETGGVLLGTFDLVRNVLHIVSALAAPQDSQQAPTYFIRGIKDLKPQIEQLSEASAGRLHYVGEWHTHPGRVPARPSRDDEGVYAYLQNHMGPVGSPFVMAICGEKDTWLRAGWLERGHLEGIIAHAAE